MISIGCDHGGFELKEKVKAHLEAKGLEVKDVGCYSKEACDYPALGRAAAQAVASGECEKGIVICTTGIGISISANKVKGVPFLCFYDSPQKLPYLKKQPKCVNFCYKYCGLKLFRDRHCKIAPRGRLLVLMCREG